jgi:predicted permease
VIGEIALAVLVLVGAGLLLRSFVRLEQVDPGFRSRGVLTLQLSLPRAKYESRERRVAFYTGLLDRLGALPGVRSVSAARPFPLTGDGWGGSFAIETRPVAPGEPLPHAEHTVVAPGYFRTLSVPLLAGRDFTEHDDAKAPLVAIVDEELARTAWPGESAIGKRINPADRPDSVWATVVGVVAHLRRQGPQDAGEQQIYESFLQDPYWTMTVALRTDGDPLALAAPARAAVRDLDPDQPIASVRRMDDLLAAATARYRFNLLLLSLFAASALLLAAVGLYGVISQLVAQRTREIGIRLALGAEPRRVLRLVLGEGLRLAAAGLAVGVAAALLASRVMATLLFEVRATDALVYASVPLLLAAVALLATYIPARRATRVDPTISMRYE